MHIVDAAELASFGPRGQAVLQRREFRCIQAIEQRLQTLRLFGAVGASAMTQASSGSFRSSPSSVTIVSPGVGRRKSKIVLD